MSIHVESLLKSKVISVVGCGVNDYQGHQCILPVTKRGMSNLTVNSGSGDYNGGDRVIGQGGYDVDGDLLFTCGWGDGASIKRLNNDGSLTNLYHDTYALYRNTTATYNHMHSLTVDPDTSTMHISSHNVDGYSMIDYSDIKDSSTSTNNVVNTRPSSQYMFSNGVNVDRSGIAYGSGVVTAGDWLYVNDYSATHYKKFPRRKYSDGTEELIDGTSSSYIYSSGGNTAATIDRDGYRGAIFYDEVNDRVYYNTFYNSNLMVIVDASTASPKCVWCDFGDAGYGDDGYEQGLMIPDPTNYPNRIYIGGSSRVLDADITPCFSGSNPTVSGQILVEDATQNFIVGAQLRHGTNRQSITNEYCDKMPGYPNYHPTSADRGRNTMGGWFDWDNLRHVGTVRHDGFVEDTSTGGRGRTYRTDYGHPVFRMQSANGTKWWIQLGYGLDGHSFKIWPNSVGNELVGNWTVEYGTWTSSASIDFVHLNAVGHYSPGSCSISYYVSNNNGSNWEAYTLDSIHNFSTSGTQLRVKYVASGQADKSPYKTSYQVDSVTFGSLYTGLLDNTIPTKIVRRKIRGRKS
jgi:hypothetical protein